MPFGMVCESETPITELTMNAVLTESKLKKKMRGQKAKIAQIEAIIRQRNIEAQTKNENKLGIFDEIGSCSTHPI